VDARAICPIISGLAGALIAYLLVRRWARSLPQIYESKLIAQVTREHRAAVVVANVLFFVGLGIALAMYQFGGYDPMDWIPIAVGFGFAFLAPVTALVTMARLKGRDPREALAAFSIGQGLPMWTVYGSVALGVFISLFAAVRAFGRLVK
jgi:hypothetical protein